jgi:phenylalanyl-tRNA synthetase beta chain
LALVVDRGVSAAALERCVRAAAGPSLVDFRLFDVYQGEGIDSAKKSMAVGLTFQDPSRTLVDADINARVDAVVSALERDLGARLR